MTTNRPTLFWDKDNTPIEDTLEWARKFEDHAYRIIAVDDDGQGQRVSTIWQGIDLEHGPYFDGDTAMIFETVLFRNGEAEDRWFWHTEEEARKGHQVTCDHFLVHRLLPGAEHLLTAPPVDGVQGPATALTDPIHGYVPPNVEHR